MTCARGTSVGTLSPSPANEFVVGHGLDDKERLCCLPGNLRDIGTLAPHVYS